MKLLIAGCLVYLCIFATILTFFVAELIPQQIRDGMQMLSNEIACQTGDDEFCNELDPDIRAEWPEPKHKY